MKGRLIKVLLTVGGCEAAAADGQSQPQSQLLSCPGWSSLVRWLFKPCLCNLYLFIYFNPFK